MLPLQDFAAGVIAEVIRRQPDSPERTAFAWSAVVGPAIARATVVRLEAGTLHVTPRDVRWGREVSRARDTILLRLQALLGSEHVRALRIATE